MSFWDNREIDMLMYRLGTIRERHCWIAFWDNQRTTCLHFVLGMSQDSSVYRFMTVTGQYDWIAYDKIRIQLVCLVLRKSGSDLSVYRLGQSVDDLSV